MLEVTVTYLKNEIDCTRNPNPRRTCRTRSADIRRWQRRRYLVPLLCLPARHLRKFEVWSGPASGDAEWAYVILHMARRNRESAIRRVDTGLLRIWIWRGWGRKCRILGSGPHGVWTGLSFETDKGASFAAGGRGDTLFNLGSAFILGAEGTKGGNINSLGVVLRQYD
jgi:hypothetical protein